MSSCEPEEVVGGQKVINFQDYNVTDAIEEYDFWDWVNKNYAYMSFGWVTCDELLYMAEGSFAPEVGDVIEDTSDGSRYFDGSITIQTQEIIKPIKVEGILSALANFDPTAPCYS